MLQVSDVLPINTVQKIAISHSGLFTATHVMGSLSSSCMEMCHYCYYGLPFTYGLWLEFGLTSAMNDVDDAQLKFELDVYTTVRLYMCPVRPR